MIYVCDKLLQPFRELRNCEWCKRQSRIIDPHHCIKRGLGGGNRIDHPLNIVGLCRGFNAGGWESCHDLADTGKIKRIDLFTKVIGPRERCAPWDIDAVLKWLARLPKDVTEWSLEERFVKMRESQEMLARRVIREMRKANPSAFTALPELENV